MKFIEVWKELSKQGMCDDAYGKEFFRVFREWLRQGKPKPLTTFIITNANKGESS